MTCHTHSGEYAGRPGRCTHGTGVTQTVVLAVSLAADTGEAMALHNTLETLTFGSTDNVYESHILSEDVGHGESVAQFEIPCEVRRKFDELAVRSGPCLFEVALESLAGVFFCSFVIGKLYGGITIIFNRTELRNNTRTSLDNGAWKILSISTENGSHSDFLSN